MIKRERIISLVIASTVFSGMLINTTTYAKINSSIEKSKEEKELESPFQAKEDEFFKINNLSTDEYKIKSDVDTNTPDLVSIIVEFKSLSNIASQKTNVSKFSLNNKVSKDHDVFNQFLKEKTSLYSSNNNEGIEGSYSVKASYYNTFNGVSMKIKGTDIHKLLECDAVKNIWSDKTVKLDLPKESEVKTKGGNPSNYLFQSSDLIGAKKLHDEGITGKGIKVAVLDTGVDYNHPDIKDNYKGGYDFVDNDDSPMETTYKEWLESGEPEVVEDNTYYTSHGTHVSGTIAANGKNEDGEMSVVGIAPEVDLYVYRVLGHYGRGMTSDIVSAIEKAVNDGMDVINLSLGANVNDPYYPTSIACNNAMIAGVTTVLANGNAGPDPGTVGAPGAAELPISVGASSTAIPLEQYNIKIDGKELKGKLFAKGFNNAQIDIAEGGKEYKIVDCGLAEGPFDFPEEVKGNIAVIQRGITTFVYKMQLAKEAGAAAVILYNNEPGDFSIYLGEQANIVPTIALSLEDGETLMNSLYDNNVDKLTLELGEYAYTEEDTLADFSSRGPASNGNIKPDITAPGVNIFSTYPEFINNPSDEEKDYGSSYARISGTSMASPHIAGVAALLLQKHNDFTPYDVKTTLMNTCDDLHKVYSVNETGAGRVNAYKAVYNDVTFNVDDTATNLNSNGDPYEVKHKNGSISFGTITQAKEDVKKVANIVVSNDSDTNKKFKSIVEYYGEEQGCIDKNDDVAISVTDNISVSSGEDINVDINLNIKSSTKVGNYQGMIRFINVDDENEEYQVPFSFKYIEPGIIAAELARNAISNDIEMVHAYRDVGCIGYFGVNTFISKLHLIVRDYETKEPIGYRGAIDGYLFAPDSVYEIPSVLNTTASYYPIVGKDVINIPRRLKEGKYYLEFYAEGIDGQTYSKQAPFIIDNQDATITVDKFKPGVIDVTDDMFETTIVEGEEHKVIWLKGNLYDNSIDILNSMGIESSPSDVVMGAFLSGMPILFQTADKDGRFKLGIENVDIEDLGGRLQVAPFALDMATSQNYSSLEIYDFIEKGKPYFEAVCNKDELKENDKITQTVSMHNFKSGSNISLDLVIPNGFDLNDYKINDEFQKYLDDNNLEAKLTGRIERATDEGIDMHVELNVVDSNGDSADINGDFDILDFNLTLINDDKMYSYYTIPVLCSSTNVTDKNGEYVDAVEQGIFKRIKVDMKSSSVSAVLPVYGLLDNTDIEILKAFEKFVWVEGPDGTKYDLTFDATINRYKVENLPVSTEEFTLVTDFPGHFRKEAVFTPSRYIGDELIGTYTRLSGGDFSDYIYAGDVNKDNVIDVLDLVEFEKCYNKPSSEIGEFNDSDFNGDNKVNIKDLEIFIKCYGNINEQATTTPKLTEVDSKGRGFEDILKDLGYYSNRATGIELNSTEISLKVGEKFTLKASVLPKNAANKDYEWIISDTTKECISLNEETGEITANAPGYVVVGVKSVDGDFSEYCSIYIDGEEPVGVPVDSFELDKYEVTITEGETEKITALINPAEATNKNVKWTSAAESVATVDNDGKITAISAGSALVSAICEDNGSSYIIKVTVNPKKEEVEKPTPEEPNPGEPEKPTPGEPEKPTPGEPEKPTPGEPEKPTPGEPEKPTPGEPEKPTPEEQEKPTPEESEKPTPEEQEKPSSGDEIPETGSIVGNNLLILYGFIITSLGVVIMRRRNRISHK